MISGLRTTGAVPLLPTDPSGNHGSKDETNFTTFGFVTFRSLFVLTYKQVERLALGTGGSSAWGKKLKLKQLPTGWAAPRVAAAPIVG